MPSPSAAAHLGPGCSSGQGPARQARTRRRRKVALACEACRLRKVKCDGIIPVCGTCRKRQDTPERCLYYNDNARTAVTKEYLNGLLDRIKTLEHTNRARGSQVNPGPYSEFQTQESPPPTEGEFHHQLNNTLNRQDEAHIVPMHRVQNSTPLQSTAKNLESLQHPNSLDQVISLQGDRSNQDGQLSQLQSDPRIEPDALDPAYFVPQRNSDHDDPVLMVHSQQAESPSLSAGSHIMKLREKPREDNHINAMGAASSVTEGSLDASDHFYGTSSVASFSRQIYQTQQRLSGNTDSLSNQASAAPVTRPTQDMLSEILTSISIPKPDDYFLPPRVLADHLLNCYWNRVHCLYPFVHQQSFISKYNRLWGADTQNTVQEPIAKVGLGGPGCSVSVFYCALNAIFALGCQFSDLPMAQCESLSDAFFRRSKQLLQIDILDEGSLALIQTLLIVAQFLQSTQFPNRCWNVVGLACRMAQGLGLYLDGENENRPFVEVEMRRRAWYGCVTLDLVLSMTLGRPMSLSDIWPVQLPRAIDDRYMNSTSLICQQPHNVFSCTSFYICTIKLYKILGSILTNVYNIYPTLRSGKTATEPSESNPLDTLVKMDCELSNFESNIPYQLHWKQRKDSEKFLVSERQSNVLHARFLHLKIVLYRPIFTQLCRKTFPGSLPVSGRKTSTEYKHQNSEDNSLFSSFSQQCSLTCVISAQELIELISITSQTDATGAWWYNIFYLFTSAMVIILAELCPAVLSNLTPMALDASWQKCQRTLELMSSYNMAAQKCIETLNAMRQKAAPGISYEQEKQPQLSKHPHPMETDPLVREESGGRNYQTDQLGSIRTGGQSPVSESVPDTSQFDDAQLWDVLWHDTGSVATWNIEEWGWGNEGMVE